MKIVQDVNYVVALGFDFKDGRYLVYSQLLDFTNVAKREGGASQQSSIWVGRGEGRSVSEALNTLYETSQQTVFWGHVATFVFTESVLKRGVETEAIDSIIRFREMRFTQWVYGTKEPIEKLFTVRPFFNLSPLSSILSEPMGAYRQDSDIRPIRLHRLIVDLREPGKTALLPSLGISEETWEKDRKADPKLYIDGVFAIRGSDSRTTWLDRKRLTGIRWFDEHATHSLLLEYSKEDPRVNVAFKKRKVEKRVRRSNGKLMLDVELSVAGPVAESVNSTDWEKIRQRAEEELRKQIRDTFEYAARNDVDIYQSEYDLYRDRFPEWSRATRNGRQPAGTVVLGDVKANVRLTHSGMYKEKDRKGEY
jgi:Ger(x)C family germination protein